MVEFMYVLDLYFIVYGLGEGLGVGVLNIGGKSINKLYYICIVYINLFI